MNARFDTRMHAYEEQTRFSGMIYVLMLVVALAFGGFVWQLYSAPEAPHIAAEPGPYKTEPPPQAEADVGERTIPITAGEPTENAASAASASAEPGAVRAPIFTANGPYVAQLAALQSEAAVEQAWRRFAARAPEVFGGARMDVQRADLGARGIYYRVRAGYFADRASASRFCMRIREMGQDCIPAAR